MDGTSATFTAPVQLGNYPMTVTAIDDQQQSLGVSETLSIEVVEPSLTCSLGNENVWSTGFVMNGAAGDQYQRRPGGQLGC